MFEWINSHSNDILEHYQHSNHRYGWEIIREYTTLMHKLVRNNNFSVKLFRATFLKLAAILETPLVRISQAESKDVVSVARYYSAELVDFVRSISIVTFFPSFNYVTQIT